MINEVSMNGTVSPDVLYAIGCISVLVKEVTGGWSLTHPFTKELLDEHECLFGVNTVEIRKHLHLTNISLIADKWVENHIGQPRSDEYKAGLKLFYERKTNKLTKTKFDMPYQVGTAQADAFLAGYSAGQIFWDAEQ